MAKTKQGRHTSALKAHRQSVKRNLRNRSIKKSVRVASRAVLDAAGAKNNAKTAELLSAASSAIDKAAKHGVFHWNAAARKKSRLVKRTAALLAPAAK